MPYHISYDPESDCIAASLEGEITPKMIIEFGAEVAYETKSHDCKRILIDVRNGTMRSSPINIFDIPAIASSTRFDPHCRRAVVVADDFEDSEFFETVTRDRGQIIRIFTDPDEAKQWLMSE